MSFNFLNLNGRTGPKPRSTITLGERGEKMAAEFLQAEGFRLVAANFKAPVGRNSRGAAVTGEIDLIALDGETLCFIEVKTRRSDEFVELTANVDLRKQRQITRTAKIYLKVFGIRDTPHRFDVVTVLLPKHAEPEIELFRGFWNESKFRKNTWNHNIWSDNI